MVLAGDPDFFPRCHVVATVGNRRSYGHPFVLGGNRNLKSFLHSLEAESKQFLWFQSERFVSLPGLMDDRASFVWLDVERTGHL